MQALTKWEGDEEFWDIATEPQRAQMSNIYGHMLTSSETSLETPG